MKRNLFICTLCLLLFALSCKNYDIKDGIRENTRSKAISLNNIADNSTFFSTVYIEDFGTISTPSDGDLWPSAWSNDNDLYTACGDGKGFGLNHPKGDLIVNKISGTPYNNNLVGTRIAGNNFGSTTPSGLINNISSIWNNCSIYNRKPTGMVSVDGNLYLAVQDLNWEGVTGPNAFNDAPASTICKSIDKGKTWTWDKSQPMFDNYIFTTIMFLDYGKDNQNAIDDYVYAYGLDYNWRDSFNNIVAEPVNLYLARVNKNQIMDRSKWEFYTGDIMGINPSWSSNIASKMPILTDTRRIYTSMQNHPTTPNNMTVISQGNIVYNSQLDRYIYSSWTEYTFEFYESPTPWGPWKHFYTKDYGGYPWTPTKNGGYATTIPSKYISNDGKTMYVQSNTFMGGASNYGFSLRKMIVEPHVTSSPINSKSTVNLAQEPKSVPICKSAHFGNTSYINDGLFVSEDSWNNEYKSLDWWGITWPKTYNINEVKYTTGTIFNDGGWFDNFKIQVRQNFEWKDVTQKNILPNYSYDASVSSNTTYTISFEDTWGDAIRILGKPGGQAMFTSISELEVRYRQESISVYDNFTTSSLEGFTKEIPKVGANIFVNNGKLVISSPNSEIFDQWINITNSPYLKYTNLIGNNFSVETKVNIENYVHNTNFHLGIYVQLAINDYLLWGPLMGQGLELSRTGIGPINYANNLTISSYYLKLVKIGNTYINYYKLNESDDWIEVGTFNLNSQVLSIGLLSKTWSPINITAKFDYIRIENN